MSTYLPESPVVPRPCVRWVGWWVAIALAACGGTDAPAPDAGPPPTFTELYGRYFGAGTAGHCAKGGCHGDPGHQIWLCGQTKDSCYAGMVSQGLITLSNPAGSSIADPARSPIKWINPNGAMPADDPSPNAEAKAAIMSWAAAGAPNN